MNKETKTESLLDGDFSCETTEDMYEFEDSELLHPSRDLYYSQIVED